MKTTNAIGMAAALGLLAAGGPAFAGTVVLNGAVQGYYSHEPDGGWGFGANFSGQGFATVGHDIHPTLPDFDGYYASLMQFALPDLPPTAVMTSATFSFSGIGGSRLGDTDLRAYLTTAGALDPDNIDGGLDLGLIRPNGLTTLDVTALIANDLVLRPTGGFAGFSLRQINNNCDGPGLYGGCFDILGSQSGVGYPIPTLSITYDVPTSSPPITPAPEPATWATMILGLAATGFALRRRAGSAGSAMRPH